MDQSQSQSLAVLAKVSMMLDKANTVGEVKKIIDITEATRCLAMARKNTEIANQAEAWKLRAQHKAGGILAQLEHGNHGGDRHSSSFQAGNLNDYQATLEEQEIAPTTAHRWQQIATMEPKILEQKISSKLKSGGELTTSGMITEAKKIAIEKKRARMTETGKTANLPKDIVQIITGDFRQILAQMPEKSIDLIFTDLPYDRESIPLYGNLAKLAGHVLKLNGSLLVYAGHYALPEILNLMTPHLRFWWTIAVEHNGNSARLPGKWIFVEWKPILWFVKKGRRDKEYVSDLSRSTSTKKEAHDWQQSTIEASYYIERLTNPGEIVLDPCCGSGTTLIAALDLGRQAIGIEIDENCARIAANNVGDHARLQTA